MITATKENVIQRSGVGSEHTFQIKATGKAFRILSDGLYSDKIRAVIRELSCNAYDAHVDGNKLDVPFHIQLPNKLEPVFKLRDFGIGLSEHDVSHVYTTYFESTKTDSNDVIGCLGLGSKSPFSYIDSFSVVSYFNGKKYIFNAFLNEDDTPTIAKLAEVDTDEPNGIEVSFPVKAEDFWEFKTKAADVLRYFKLRPTISGQEITIPEVSYFMEGTGWGLRSDKVEGAVAIMGNVSYPIRGMNADLTEKQNRLVNYVPIDITFNIGELEVAASRESLSYNKSTIDSIKKRLDLILNEVENNVVQQIKDCPSLWEARILAYKLVKGEYSTVKGIIGKSPFEWGGNPITVGYHHTELSNLSINHFFYKETYRRYTSGCKIIKESTSSIQCTEGVVFFWDDLTSGSHVRCKQVLNNENGTVKNVYLVSGTPEDIKELELELGLESPIPPVSSIIREKKVCSNSYDVNPLNSSKLLVYDDSDANSQDPSSWWRKEKLRVNDGGVYVIINRYKISDEMPSCYMNRMAETLKLVNEDLGDIDVIGAKCSMYSKLSSMSEWTSLEDYVKEKVMSYFKVNNVEDTIISYKELQKLKHDTQFLRYRTVLGEIATEMVLDKDSRIMKLLDTVKEIEDTIYPNNKINSNIESYVCLANRYQYLANVEANKMGLLEIWNDISSQYPLMFAVSAWDISSYNEAIKDYIRVKDMATLLEDNVRELAVA